MFCTQTRVLFSALLLLAVCQAPSASAQMSKDDVGGLLTGSKRAGGDGRPPERIPSEVAGPDLPVSSVLSPERAHSTSKPLAADGYLSEVTPQAVSALLKKNQIESALKNADSAWPYLLIKASKHRWMSIYFRKHKGHVLYLYFYTGYRISNKEWSAATYEKINKYNASKIFSSYKYINKSAGTKHHILAWSLWTEQGANEDKIMAYYRTLMGELDSFNKVFGYGS